MLLTDDGVSIEARYEPSPGVGTEPSDRLALVVGHGFSGAWSAPRCGGWHRRFTSVRP